MAAIFSDYMHDLLNNLKATIDKLGARAFFNAPAQMNDVTFLLERIPVSMPEKLKEFYLKYNGGFIADLRWTKAELLDIDNFKYIQWNSNHFFSLDMILSLFDDPDELINYANEISPSEEKYLPFFRSQEQEIYVIKVSSKNPNIPVYVLGRQTMPEDWSIVNNDFYDFLKAYVDTEGNILTW